MTLTWKSVLWLIITIILVAWIITSFRPTVSEGTIQEIQRIIANEVGDEFERATFAGGCFWCMEPPFEKLEGVIDAVSGYAGGHVVNPTYEQVITETTGHLEVVQVIYDPKLVSYHDLLQVFWRQIDPTDGGGQFVDRGESYTTAIFVHDEGQRLAAEQSKLDMNNSGRFSSLIVTPIRELEVFYRAEEYHQNFYIENPTRYRYYRQNSGRDSYLQSVWGDDVIYEVSRISSPYQLIDKQARLEQLTPQQYKITQEDGTERAYQNEYHDNKRDGIYVDIVSGEPLFSSLDQYDSRTGWPSFTKPLVPEHIVYHEDNTLFMTRIEVRSRYADSHLGHVFRDGPEPTGLRYCINSAAMRFIPVEQLIVEGYKEFLPLFDI